MGFNYHKKGVYNAICDSCDFKFKSNQLKETWDGFMVCNDCYETRHVSDFQKVPKPSAPLPFTRPEPTDEFVTVDYISESIGTQET